MPGIILHLLSVSLDCLSVFIPSEELSEDAVAPATFLHTKARQIII